MLFRDRREAGRFLARKLMAYADRPDVLVLAFNRAADGALQPARFELFFRQTILRARPHCLGGELYIGHRCKNNDRDAR